jgi:hypothetical protein
MVWMAPPNFAFRRTARFFRYQAHPLLLALLLLAPGTADEVKSLSLSHKIGADWDEGSHQWMNFVALSADGKTGYSR